MAVQTSLGVYIGEAQQPVGRLVYVKDGAREFSQFAYAQEWLAHPQCFNVSPDLQAHTGYQVRKPANKGDTCFFGALADTEPDAWGRRVIARAHARARAGNPGLGPLTEVDYLSAVDDFSRVGALRLVNEPGPGRRTAQGGKGGEGSEGGAGATPTLLELERVLSASRAVELSQETAQDLAYLQGRATSLGGMRPKCTVLDVDGSLALGKFPSVSDERSVTKGEVLALHLAARAGVQAAQARVVQVQGQDVAIVRRFDRLADRSRVPYISGSTMLQVARDAERAYTELLDVMRGLCQDYLQDARQLWRRLVFNHLINNVDDHLQNIGFLYAKNSQWRLAPAFDLNPFPDKQRESKTWLSEDTGPIASLGQLLSQAPRFELTQAQAQQTLAEVRLAIADWRAVAATPGVGMRPEEQAQFADAFVV